MLSTLEKAIVFTVENGYFALLIFLFVIFSVNPATKRPVFLLKYLGNRHIRVAILPYCILMHLTIVRIIVQRNVSAVTLFHLDPLYVSQCASHNGEFVLGIFTTMLCISIIAIQLGYDCLIVRWKCSF